MKGFLFILLIFSIQSCTKWHEVREGNGILYVHKAESELHTLSETQWEVGKKRNKTVSKGVRFKFDIPKISSDDSLKLTRKHGIDSWIFRVVKLTRGRKRVLGNIVYSLHNISRSSNDITVRVYYHAAAVSQIFRKFKCPAFGHRFKLNQYKMNDTSKKFYDVFASRGKYLQGTFIRPSFSPVIFSGDLSLLGTYSVEFALFNSKEKKLFSRWHKANNTINVITEDRVSIPSCAGIKEENDLKNNRPPRAEEFRIK